MTRSNNHRPRLERVIGQPETFRLTLRGLRFELRRADVVALAEDLTRVLANVARDDAAAAAADGQP